MIQDPHLYKVFQMQLTQSINAMANGDLPILAQVNHSVALAPSQVSSGRKRNADLENRAPSSQMRKVAGAKKKKRFRTCGSCGKAGHRTGNSICELSRTVSLTQPQP